MDRGVLVLARGQNSAESARKERGTIGARGVLAAVFYACLLGVSQVFVIAPAFGYYGFTVGDPSITTIAVTSLSYALAALQLPRSLTRPSHITCWVLFLLVVAPVHVTPILLDLQGRPSPVPFTLALSACFVVLCQLYRFPLLRTGQLPIPPPVFWSVLSLLVVSGTALLAMTFGVSLDGLNLGEIYGIREQYRESLEAAGGGIAYVVSWMAYVLAPLLATTGVLRRSVPLFLSGISVQLLIYSFTGYKSVLFSVIFLMVFLVASRRTAERMVGVRLLWGAATAVLLVTVYDLLTGDQVLSSLFVRRLVHTAGLNSYRYYEFFSAHPQVHLTQSIFSFLGQYPYSSNPPFLIGQVYFNSTETSANANLWADAYANFGFAGMLAFTAALGLFLWLYDSLAVTRDKKLSALLIAMPSFSLSNSALLTSLLTHGFLVALLIIVVLPADLMASAPMSNQHGRRVVRRGQAVPLAELRSVRTRGADRSSRATRHRSPVRQTAPDG